MRNHHRYFFMAVVCLFLGLQAVAAQTDQLNGTVKGLDSAGKHNAYVRFDGAARYSASTDAGGRFSIKKFTAGNYTITVQQGSHRQTFIYTIRLGSPLNLKVPW